MLYLLQQFWPYCLVALILGLLVSWFTRGKADGRSFWFTCLLIVGIVGLILAVLFFFKGKMGLLLEVALLALGSYLIGCLIPCLLGCWGSKASDVDGAARPAGLMAPRGGKGDDLTKLRLIDKNREAKMNGLGIYHYDQICALKGDEKSWLWHAIDLKSVSGDKAKANEWAGWAQSCDLAALSKAGVKTIPASAAAAAPAVLTAVVPAVAAVATKAAEPVQQQMAKVEGEDLIAGQRPVGFTTARNNKADDLKRIRGIGPQNEGRLHGLGIWHFDQISAWTAQNIEWVGSYLAFPGRIDREDWVAQAKVLATGAETEFSKRVDKGEVPSSKDDGSHGQSNIEKVDPKK